MDLHTELGDARNVLLSAPSMSGDERGVCTDLLLGADPAETSVLWVTFRRDPGGCIEQWTGATADVPLNGAVIAVGGAGAGDVDVEWADVESVSSASDLTGLGIAIGEFLSVWEGDVVVCFDSLTAMLQYVELETAYEFLHAVTGQLYAADARAHFHMDPSAHDVQTVDSITSLFDAVVELGGGDLTVRKRSLLG
ncbi:MAG: hypothetical protein V5A28_03750 [Haloarculaceae archaeon]